MGGGVGAVEEGIDSAATAMSDDDDVFDLEESDGVFECCSCAVMVIFLMVVGGNDICDVTDGKDFAEFCVSEDGGVDTRVGTRDAHNFGLLPEGCLSSVMVELSGGVEG